MTAVKQNWHGRHKNPASDPVGLHGDLDVIRRFEGVLDTDHVPTTLRDSSIRLVCAQILAGLRGMFARF